MTYIKDLLEYHQATPIWCTSYVTLDGTSTTFRYFVPKTAGRLRLVINVPRQLYLVHLEGVLHCKPIPYYYRKKRGYIADVRSDNDPRAYLLL